MIFKNFFRSMSGRVFLILIGGVIGAAMLALVLAAFAQREMITQIRARHAVERTEQLVLTLEATPASARPTLAAIGQKFGAKIDLSPAKTDASVVSDTEFVLALSRALGDQRRIMAFKRSSYDCPVRNLGLDVDGTPHCMTVILNLADGTPVRLDISLPSDRHLPPFRRDFLPFLLVFICCVGLVAVGVAVMATRPLRQLALAANELGHDIERAPMLEEGPTEVREAAAAFNNMQRRIRSYIQERTHMLAAIAHDLQTPLTRMRLRLEKVAEDELRQKLIHDLSATQVLVKEGLELARSQDSGEPFELLDIDSLIDSLCADAADAGLEVTHSSEVGSSIMARPNALRRCLLNLVENAVKYGKFAHVAAKREGDRILISIIDGGPGIPEQQLETVFQPFYRLETSRSREFGGTGLGLTIARNIAEKHRGTLRLRNICSGGLGLEATITLPIG